MNTRIVTVTSLFAALLVIVFPDTNLASFDSTRHEAKSIWSATYESSRPRELPPQSLTEPYVNLSIHTAPIVQPTHTRNASEQTTMVGVS